MLALYINMHIITETRNKKHELYRDWLRAWLSKKIEGYAICLLALGIAKEFKY
jgi:hypothetical protein